MNVSKIKAMKPRERKAMIAELSHQEKVTLLNEILKEAKRTVFFGGAGASTESGIPDFRSKDGLYNQHDVQFDQYSPEYLLSHDCLYHNSKVFFEYYRQKMNVEGILPNKAHLKLAEMERLGKLSAIVTQNIDGLHQKAGSQKVYEIHGTTMRNYCSNCGKSYPSDYIFKSQEAVPHCTKCGGMIRPDVTMYGESLPMQATNQAIRAIANADVLIIGGTSLSVYPANGMVNYFDGDFLVLINRDPTPHDIYADLVFHDSLGEIMGQMKF